MNKQSGYSSILILLFLVLAIFLTWEISQFADQFNLSGERAFNNGGRNCVGGPDLRDCDDIDEGDGTVDLSGLNNQPRFESEVFGWTDDGKP